MPDIQAKNRKHADLPVDVNNTAINAKKPIRGPPELNKVRPSLPDIQAKNRKHADLPVDVNNTAINAKKPIRGPPELNKVRPSLPDIQAKNRKHADLPVDVNNTAINAKKPIRGPPELNKVRPSLADINTTSKPSEDADLPVDVLLLTVKNCEFLACYSELKNPYRCYFEDLGYVYFSDVSESQEEVKVALLRCHKTGPGGSLISVKNAATVLRPKAVISVGACSGLHPEKCKLGDVVVSAKLATYASKVVISNQEQSTGMSSYVSKRFLNVIKNCADGWKAPLKNPADAQQVDVYTAAEFLSGPEQVSSGQRRDQLAETNPQAIAMENEGEGKLTVVFVGHHNQHYM